MPTSGCHTGFGVKLRLLPHRTFHGFSIPNVFFIFLGNHGKLLFANVLISVEGTQGSVFRLLDIGSCEMNKHFFQTPFLGASLLTIAVTNASVVSAQTEDPSICGTADFAHQVAEMTNIERFQNGGLPPLKFVQELNDSSFLHSVNMAERNFFAHCDLDTKKLPWDRMRDAGYNWNRAGENIAAGYSSADRVMSGWMNSSGHRANILNANFREIGVGYYYFGSDTPDTRRDIDNDCNEDGRETRSFYRYWTQNFGTRNSVYPIVINLESHMTDRRDVALYVYGEGWASEMRIRNNSGPWTPWQPYAKELVWALDKANGQTTVTVEIRNASGSVKSASDDICLAADMRELIFEDGFE